MEEDFKNVHIKMPKSLFNELKKKCIDLDTTATKFIINLVIKSVRDKR
jgi:hypothetical protein